MSKIIVVPELAVRVFSAESCYAFEKGVPTIYAHVLAEDRGLAEELSQAEKDGIVVTLRCAMLDVTGKLRKSNGTSGLNVFIVVVEDVTYRKPRGP